jgi:hypothetical protein
MAEPWRAVVRRVFSALDHRLVDSEDLGGHDVPVEDLGPRQAASAQHGSLLTVGEHVPEHAR